MIHQPINVSDVPNIPKAAIQIVFKEEVGKEILAAAIIEIINVMERLEFKSSEAYALAWTPELGELELQRIDAAFQYWNVQYTLENPSESPSNG